MITITHSLMSYKYVRNRKKWYLIFDIWGGGGWVDFFFRKILNSGILATQTLQFRGLIRTPQPPNLIHLQLLWGKFG